MKKKISKKEQEYINKIVLTGKNVTLAGEVRRLLGELSVECQNKKLKIFIDILNWHLTNHRDWEKCPYCDKKEKKLWK